MELKFRGGHFEGTWASIAKRERERERERENKVLFIMNSYNVLLTFILISYTKHLDH